MIYCKETTENHHLSISYSNCLLSLNEMIQKENKDKRCSAFDNSWITLDLDAVECIKASNEGKRERNSTCDCTVGVTEKGAKKMLLIEYRLNYKSINGISEGDLDSKVRGSIALMGHDPAILKSIYFVFQDKIKSQAHRRLRQMKSNRKEYIAVTINELKDVISA